MKFILQKQHKVMVDIFINIFETFFNQMLLKKNFVNKIH